MQKSDKNQVIIGNSAAAIGAVEALRQNGNRDPILLISDEPFPAYSRPLISELLAGQISGERMFYRPAEFYSRHQVEPLLGVRAEKVDPEKKLVKLEEGRALPYARLLIATGSSPVILPIEGKDLRGVFTFMKWQEAEALQEAAARARRAVVIGGGLIGLKAAEALRHVGLEVSVVELAPRLLPAAADEVASAQIKEHLREEGLKVFTSTTVDRIEGEGGQVSAALLSSGERIPADMVVIAIGVKPNIGLVKGTSIKVRQGIVVDSHMRTTAPEVYAAGDVAEGYDRVLGEHRVLPLWPVAYRQGAVAGANMAGQEKEYEGFFAMNSIQLFGLPLISMGRLEVPDEPGYEVLSSNNEGNYRKIILKDGVIVGAVFLRAIDRAGIIAGLIRERLSVEAFKEQLLSEDFGLLSLPREWRKEKLARFRSPRPAGE